MINQQYDKILEYYGQLFENLNHVQKMMTEHLTPTRNNVFTQNSQIEKYIEDCRKEIENVIDKFPMTDETRKIVENLEKSLMEFSEAYLSQLKNVEPILATLENYSERYPFMKKNPFQEDLNALRDKMKNAYSDYISICEKAVGKQKKSVMQRKFDHLQEQLDSLKKGM